MSQPRIPIAASQIPEDALRQRQPSSIPLRIVAVCLTSALVSVNYTNYGPLIPTLHSELHISNGQAGLFSTLLFLGLAVAYIPGGILADRFGSRPILLGSSFLFVSGELLLPLYPNLTWMLACRAIVGLGSGAAFVAGARVAASLEKHSSLGQGLYGGSVQVGSGSGLLITPLLLAWFGWRGAFLVWGLAGISSILLWLFVHEAQESHWNYRADVGAGLRSPSVWTLGLSHMGTFGLGNAIAAWISIYLVHQYGLALGLAATIGSVALLTGMFFRPLGGVLIGRRIIGAIPLLRLGTVFGFLGVFLLALPFSFVPLLIAGMGLIAIGATIPYTSVFNEAAHLRGVSKGIGQALVSVISIPTVLLGPPLIGYLFQQTGSFTPAFASILLFSAVAVTASFLAGSAVKRETTA
jgi:nitrate/nitrite transporter NarK